MRPPLAEAPTIDDINAIENPLQRVIQINAVAERWGTLTKPLREIRIRDLRHLLESHGVCELAALLGLTHGRISQLAGSRNGRRAQRPRSTRRP